MDAETIKNFLDICYDKVLDGVPMVSKSVEELANDYLSRTSSPEKAAKHLIHNQVLKCGTSGAVTGMGGLITLPVAIPANIASVVYVQLRMIASIAYIGGFDPSSDQVQTLSYVCLLGSSAADALKQSGIKISQKFLTNVIEKKIPGTVLKKINEKVGFRLLTKFGTTGAINLGKCVPVVGGVVGGLIDISSSKIVALNAYRMFILKKDL